MCVLISISQAKGLFITNRAALLGFAAGGTTGAVYKGLGDLLFASTRELWLEQRANRELHSKHKALLVRKNRMVTFEQMQDEQARQSARQKLQQEAEQMRAQRSLARKLESSKTPSSTPADEASTTGK